MRPVKINTIVSNRGSTRPSTLFYCKHGDLTSSSFLQFSPTRASIEPYIVVNIGIIDDCSLVIYYIDIASSHKIPVDFST